MPWRETVPMDERSRFIDAYLAGGFTMTELCACFQVSRRVGYKWAARYDAEGRRGLADRSRAPLHCPHKVPDAVVALLCQARRKHGDPRATLAAQQRAFNAFRTGYNEERPHQTLHGATPSSRYRASPRPYPAILPAIDYPSHFLVKDVTAAGTFRLGDRLYFLSNALRHYPVGQEDVDDGLWSIFFCH